MTTDGSDRDRVAMIQNLDPKRVEEYIEAHEDVPDAVSDQMAESGVHRFELFVDEAISVGYLEVDDFDRFVEEYSANPACEAWEREVGEYKRSGVETDEEQVPTMDRIWSLEESTD